MNLIKDLRDIKCNNNYFDIFYRFTSYKLSNDIHIKLRVRQFSKSFICRVICRKASKRIRIKRFFGACPFLFFDSFNLPRDQNEICKLVSYTIRVSNLNSLLIPSQFILGCAVFEVKLNFAFGSLRISPFHSIFLYVE